MKDIEKVSEMLIKEGYTQDMFSVHGYKDRSVCLEKNGSNWIVYTGWEGRKNELSLYRTLDEACEGMRELLIEKGAL